MAFGDKLALDKWVGRMVSVKTADAFVTGTLRSVGSVGLALAVEKAGIITCLPWHSVSELRINHANDEVGDVQA